MEPLNCLSPEMGGRGWRWVGVAGAQWAERPERAVQGPSRQLRMRLPFPSRPERNTTENSALAAWRSFLSPLCKQIEGLRVRKAPSAVSGSLNHCQNHVGCSVGAQ